MNWDSLFSEHESDYQILDIGCGTGRFPRTLQNLLPPTVRLHYDYLDPSQYCLSTCHQSLHQPFYSRNAWQTTLEHAEKILKAGFYDVAWAIQSLYGLHYDTLHKSLSRLIEALLPIRETACMVLAKQEAFFSRLNHTFFQDSPAYTPAPYLSGESVATGLEKLGVFTVIREIPCIHSISIRQDRLLEQYFQPSVWIQPPCRFGCNNPDYGSY